MLLTLIWAVTAVNLALAAHYLRRFARQRSPLGLAFVMAWLFDYGVGNILTLLSRDRTFNLLEFDEFAGAYLVALLCGQYFLFVYANLLHGLGISSKRTARYPPAALPHLALFLGVSTLFALLLVYRVGPAEYFSPELAFFRARLGELAGRGVGVYYYLAMLLIPATLMVGAYALEHKTRASITLTVLALLLCLVFFVPLGGRGRVINILIILIITHLILGNEYRLSRLLSARAIALLLLLLVTAYVWGALRDDPFSEVSADSADVIHRLSVDLSRLYMQAYILERYSAWGSYSGSHYLESLLGPFMQYLPLSPAGLIPRMSADWFWDTIGGVDVQSAMSPSFIGEVYMNFGVVGLVLAPFMLYALLKVFVWLFTVRHPLAQAVLIYMFQFNFFHGGLYALFDMLVVTVPLLVGTRYLVSASTRGRATTTRRMA